jgi:putative flavoprotein involved in K+ transport
VVIVGGGQCGLALAARLQRMSVPYVVLDQNPRPGDSWRNRGFDDASRGAMDFWVFW